jgi:hypothetical protein
VLTLGYSRKLVRLLVFHSGSQIWAELHEKAFRRLGGATKIAQPALRDVLAHYSATPLPCRVGHPDRKGKVESGVGHAQKTPLKGLRFETLDEAQTYLDHGEERWANTRIHDTTKRQVAAVFADEKPMRIPLPSSPPLSHRLEPVPTGSAHRAHPITRREYASRTTARTP